MEAPGLGRESNLFIAKRFDDEARRLEALEGGTVLLRETFRLRREISTAALDLWHVKGIICALADGKAKIRGVDLKDEKVLDDLLAETESLLDMDLDGRVRLTSVPGLVAGPRARKDVG